MNENGRIEKGPTDENKIDFIITILFSPPEIQHFFLVLTKVSLTSAGQMSWTNSKVFKLKSNYTNLLP